MEEGEKKYSLFNGRRSADQYVKGYLKGVALISAVGLTVFMSFSGWLVFQLAEQEKSTFTNNLRISAIEASRFTMKDAIGLKDSVNDNSIQNTKLESLIRAITKDLDEIKQILRRSAPYERRSTAER